MITKKQFEDFIKKLKEEVDKRWYPIQTRDSLLKEINNLAKEVYHSPQGRVLNKKPSTKFNYPGDTSNLEGCGKDMTKPWKCGEGGFLCEECEETSNSKEGCGKWYSYSIKKGLSVPNLCGRNGLCPECQKKEKER